jgi:hypothetical protein
MPVVLGGLPCLAYAQPGHHRELSSFEDLTSRVSWPITIASEADFPALEGEEPRKYPSQ